MWRGETAFLPNGAGIPTKVGILSVTISLTYQSDDMILHAPNARAVVQNLSLRVSIPPWLPCEHVTLTAYTYAAHECEAIKTIAKPKLARYPKVNFEM
jgi:hypothetical protein